MKTWSWLSNKLNAFHRPISHVIKGFSPMAGSQFPGNFNVSGFHDQILKLPDHPSAIWGIDRCLRIREKVDACHSYVFHMGIFAQSVDLNGDFREPWKDIRFHVLQKEILDQFFALLNLLGVDHKSLEFTYLAGVNFEGLKKKYYLPEDIVSKKYLKKLLIKSFPVHSPANIDAVNIEGALVGSRLEVASNGIEIGTIVFDCFKVKKGKLVPINYVGGYALGMERLLCSVNGGDFIRSIGRYTQAGKKLFKKVKAVQSILLKDDVLGFLFGTEALACVPDSLARGQKELVRRLKKNLKEYEINLGLSQKDTDTFITYFKQWKS
ncbi:MAG: hypothetical protein PHC53_02305 [Patescibacteria group bacterium]|nr:hypothetical protein [Patescibacteria group bacterium]